MAVSIVGLKSISSGRSSSASSSFSIGREEYPASPSSSSFSFFTKTFGTVSSDPLSSVSPDPVPPFPSFGRLDELPFE